MIKNSLTLHSGKSILPVQEDMIEKILASQFEKAQARLILLLDTNGQVISFQGSRGSIDLVALGALAAADMAASSEIARISNVYQDNQMIIRQGSKINSIIYEIGHDFIILFMVPVAVPLGWFCYLVRNTAEQIKDVVLTVPVEAQQPKFDESSENIEDLVSHAFNNIWKE